MPDIDNLKEAIKKLHGCEAEHVGSVPVHEVFQGKTIWNGTVEVFTLNGHPKAKRCYAWSHAHGEKDEERRYVAVLEISPVESAISAVRVAIADEFKRKK